MRRMRSPSKLTAVILVTLAGAVALAIAAEVGRATVPVPMPPKGKGEACVADKNFMRRYHMTMLIHQREQTVIEGIRTKRFSFKECVACHAVDGRDGQPVSYRDPKHFCRSCHDYAAVKIDCFECHASKPEIKSITNLVGPDRDSAAILLDSKDTPR